MTTPLLGLPELATSQANKEETVNEIARKLEAGACGPFPIEDRDLDAAPGSPTDGQLYLVDGTPAGGDDWAGRGGDIALFMNTDWEFYEVKEGMAFWIKDEDVLIIATSSSTFEALATGNPTESLIVAVGDETTDLTTGTGKITFRMPYAFTLSAVRASVTTAPTGAALTVDINEGGTTILSTKLTIDASEKTSTTAATPPVISDSALADDAEITIDIDQVGSTIAGAGLKVTLIGTRAA